MKIVFMGTPDFAVYSLDALIKNHEVVAVISQPDKPKGRGKKLQPTPVKIKAEENNIPVYQPERIKDSEFCDFLETIEADLFVVVAYGQILSERILKMPKYGCINVHGSLLPQYRGAAPIQWSIINGDSKTGVTIMYMDKECDTGDMILKEEIDITSDETYESLHDKMAPIGADCLIDAIKLIENNNADAKKQDNNLATYAPMIKKELGHIDWSKNADEIRNLVRGLNPMPGAYTFYNGEMIKIWECEIAEGNSGNIGEITEVNPKLGFRVSCKDKSLIITKMQAKGGKKMNTADYMRGHSIDVGSILS
ncbi:MAG: methionyl-tRNA formyltransferase [Lachnospirales bacterium]